MGQFCPVGDWSDRTVLMWLHAAHSHSKELKQNMTIRYSNQEQFMYFICNCPLVISSVSLFYFSIKGANPMGGGGGGGRGRISHIHTKYVYVCMRVLLYLFGVQKVVLVPLRVFSLKRSTVGAFGIPFRLLSQMNLTGHNMLFHIKLKRSSIPLWTFITLCLCFPTLCEDKRILVKVWWYIPSQALQAAFSFHRCLCD